MLAVVVLAAFVLTGDGRGAATAARSPAVELGTTTTTSAATTVGRRADQLPAKGARPPTPENPPSPTTTVVVEVTPGATLPSNPEEVPPPAPPPAPSDVVPAAGDDPCAAVLSALPVGPPSGWVVLCLGPRSGLWGEANPVRHDIRLYLRPEWSTTTAARILAHELGHAYDWTVLTDADRAAWMQARGLGGAWGGSCPTGQVCRDTDRPAGDWAEAVGELLVPGTALWDSHLGGVPTGDQLAVVRAILRNGGIAV